MRKSGDDAKNDAPAAELAAAREVIDALIERLRHQDELGRNRERAKMSHRAFRCWQVYVARKRLAKRKRGEPTRYDLKFF